MKLMALFAIALLGLSACASRPVLIDRFVPETGTSFAGACYDVPADAYALNVCTLNQSVAYYDLRNVTDNPYYLVVV